MSSYPKLYQGFVGGVKSKGFMGWLMNCLVCPKTDRYHHIMIGEYIPDDDDYVILESINKGIALGRLSMYQPEDMEIYKVNVDDWEALGKKATLALTRYGRCSYDFMLIIRLLIYAPIMLIKHGLPPWHPEELPYRRDNHFICTEAANRGWADIGYPFIPEGVIPMPASFKLALKRGRLLRVYPV